MVEFGQRGLDRAITSIDHKHLGFHPRDHFKRFGNLADFFHFIMEDIGIFCAIRPNHRQQRPVAG
jgi:hypothetical protein